MNNISLRKTALILIFLTYIHNSTAYYAQANINQIKLFENLSNNSQKKEDNKKEPKESSNAQKILVGILVLPAILFFMCIYLDLLPKKENNTQKSEEDDQNQDLKEQALRKTKGKQEKKA